MNKPNVLFLLVDCLRSDKTADRKLKGRLPNIHSMIDHGTTFTDMISVNSYTVPCVASLFTSLYPVNHHVRGMLSGRIPKWASTLAELFKASGYHTYGSVAGPLEAWIGFDRGFDHYKMRVENDEHLYSNWKDNFITMIKSGYKAPWFAYIHFWEVHQPRQILPEYNSQEFGETLYDRAISSWDSVFGDILDIVQPDTLVILTGDHGEVIARNKMEHLIDRYKTPIRNLLMKLGATENMLKVIPKMRANLMQFLHKKGTAKSSMSTMIGHGYHVYDPLVRVPFVMMNDSIIPSSKLIDKQVSQVDILPTIVDLLGLLPPKHNPDGRSLVPILHNEPWIERPAFIEAGSLNGPNGLEKSNIGAVRYQGWKYAYGLHESTFSEELYCLLKDPNEQRNLSELELKKKAELRNIAESHFNSQAEEQLDEMDEELTCEERDMLEGKLKDLGYM